MSYTDLITRNDLRVLAPAMIANASTVDNATLDRCIANASQIVETYLGQKLIARSYTETVKSDRWDYDSGTLKYEAMMHFHPVVQVDTAGLSVDTSALSVITATDAQSVQSVTYYAGYKRHDQGLSDLSAVTGLTSTPSDLPSDMTRCVARIALFDAMQGVQGTIGQGKRVTTGYGGEQVKEGVDNAFIDRELMRLSIYQRAVFYV